MFGSVRCSVLGLALFVCDSVQFRFVLGGSVCFVVHFGIWFGFGLG